MDVSASIDNFLENTETFFLLLDSVQADPAIASTAGAPSASISVEDISGVCVCVRITVWAYACVYVCACERAL